MKHAHSRGYSLIEALVTVAIVGLVSLVTIPNFMNMQRQAKVRTSMRSFTSDIRFARQRAVTKGRRVLVTFATGAGKSAYRVFERTPKNDGTFEWIELRKRTMDKAVYFSATTFHDEVDPTAASDDNSLPDIIYRENGTIDPTDLPTGVTAPELTLKSDFKVAKPSYRVTFSVAGNVRAD